MLRLAAGSVAGAGSTAVDGAAVDGDGVALGLSVQGLVWASQVAGDRARADRVGDGVTPAFVTDRSGLVGAGA